MTYVNPVSDIHWLCSFLYSFKCTKNCISHHCFLCFLISSTLYSFYLLIISSDGTEYMCCPLKYSSLHCISMSSLNMLWIAYSSGNSSWNAPWPIFFEILKDLYLLWSSFFEGQLKWLFLDSSHTLLPTFNPCGFLLFLSNCFFMAFAISVDFFAAFQLSCSSWRKLSSFGNSILIVRFSFHGCHPKLSLNRV